MTKGLTMAEATVDVMNDYTIYANLLFLNWKLLPEYVVPIEAQASALYNSLGLVLIFFQDHSNVAVPEMLVEKFIADMKGHVEEINSMAFAS